MAIENVSYPVYVVITEWACDGQLGQEMPWVFRKLEDAQWFMKRQIQEYKSEGWIKDDWIEESTDYTYEIYEDGMYCENHVSISIHISIIQ